MVRILVVEDDEKLNRSVCASLGDHGHQAKGCLSARDAYDEMYNSLYDLIISDIMMPEIDGFEFARTVRELMDEFWGVDSDTSLRAVDVYITKLRDKCSVCDGFKIVTVHGLGYKAVLQ